VKSSASRRSTKPASAVSIASHSSSYTPLIWASRFLVSFRRAMSEVSQAAGVLTTDDPPPSPRSSGRRIGARAAGLYVSGGEGRRRRHRFLRAVHLAEARRSQAQR